MHRFQSILVLFTLVCSSANANVIEDLIGNRLTRKADRLEKKLELNLTELKTDKHDKCAVDQLHTFLKSYRHLSASKKSELKYSTHGKDLVLEPTTQVGHISGQEFVLEYQSCHWVYSRRGGYRDCTTYAKNIGEKLNLEGSKPKTEIVSDSRKIDVKPQSLKDNRTVVHYITYNGHVYATTKSVDSPEFKRDLDIGIIYYSGSRNLNHTECGSTGFNQ